MIILFNCMADFTFYQMNIARPNALYVLNDTFNKRMRIKNAHFSNMQRRIRLFASTVHEAEANLVETG